MRNATMRLLPATLVIIVAACDAPERIVTPRQAGEPLASARTGITVTSTNPSFGYQGERGRRVAITGTGFTAGAVVAWERNGASDPGIVVVSSVVVSSTRIDATIDIAAEAELSYYDISVTSSKGKGIGTEMFEVTTAIPLGFDGEGNGVADMAEGARIGGRQYQADGCHAFVFDVWSRTFVDLGAGQVNTIDAAGLTLGGAALTPRRATVWTHDGRSWSAKALPTAADATSSGVNAIASDASGNALYAVGPEHLPRASDNPYRPILWVRTAGGWARIALMPGRTAKGAATGARGVNARGQVAGTVRWGSGGSPDQAVFWDSLGTATLLPGSGFGFDLDASGTVVAGSSGGEAVIWTAKVDAKGGRTWSGPHRLPGACQDAVRFDGAGRLIGRRCKEGQNRYASALWEPPYAAVTTLHGLGGVEGGNAWGISRGGGTIVGGSDGVAVMWEMMQR